MAERFQVLQPAAACCRLQPEKLCHARKKPFGKVYAMPEKSLGKAAASADQCSSCSFWKVPCSISRKAARSSSSVFMTMGPPQAIGSCSGAELRKRT